MKRNGKKRILFVCGYSFLLESYALRLKQSNFEVFSLEDANDNFVEKVVDIKPDLIYLYIILPGRDGFEALKMLKEDSRTKDIPVIFENKKSKLEDVEKGIKLGAIDYVVDEYTNTEIVARMAIDYLTNRENYVARYPIFTDMLKAKHLDMNISKVVEEKMQKLGITISNFGQGMGENTVKNFYNPSKTKRIFVLLFVLLITFILILLKKWIETKGW